MPEAPARCFDKTRTRLAALHRSADWPLVTLTVAFVLVAPVFGGASGFKGAMRWFGRLVITTPTEAYEQSIAAAAIKGPGFDHGLQIIDTTKPMKAVRVRSPGPIDSKKPMWVALEDELHAACKGAANPVRRLQQVLGLPPLGGDRVVTPIEIAPDQLSNVFRPCFRGGGLTEPKCGLPAVGDVPPPADPADGTAQRRMNFLANHIWDSDQTGFMRPDGSLNFGYPFTGMGWTYDWSTRSHNHVGVSEFIVSEGTTIKVGADIKPADFCK